MSWKTIEETTQELKPPPGVIYSKYQIGAFDYVRNNLRTGNHLIVQACAGSGKSFTGVEMFRMLSRELDTAFVAFNKPIARDLDLKVKADWR